MRIFLLSFMLSVSAISFAVTQSKAVEIIQPKGVVEIFTSQGCYSCPPADKLVGKFAKSDEIFALSWHVNYWDYLGWKDVFASKLNTQRQYRYASSLKERQVYTPQAIINGRAHAVGSNEYEIKRTLDELRTSNRGITVPINAIVTDKSFKIEIPESDVASEATLYLILFNKEHEVNIKRGENGGKTLSYFNVVHDIQTLGMVQSTGLTMEFPIAEMKRSGYDGCALILQKEDQSGNPSAIVGATVITDL